ncbi:uncharacterized protein LOC134833916 [Culicoides brevitarsis]|uniref:uncharacterized protein LOC134833916 n=1 Tax=Culicoides brevitarsis TaxID=469753 RepID=UPI00307BACD5
MFKATILLVTLFVASAFGMEGIKECKYINAPLPMETSNSLCEKNPCTITNGASVETTTTFKTTASSSLKYNVDAYLGSFKIPIDFVPAEDQDACKGLTSGKCPVKDGDVVTHQIKLPVEAPMEATISMEAYVTDENKKALFCYRTQITVKN